MATTFDDHAVVNYDEPPVKPPPMLVVGPLAWMRQNLFRSTFDTVVTFVSAVLLVAVVTSLFQWMIGAANWFVITTNLRLLLAGRFPAESIWRLEWAARLCALVVGFTLMAYVRVRRVLVIALGIVLALLLIVPVLIGALIPPAVTTLAAGETAIVSGTVSETPQTQTAFIARGGETITIRFADASGDEALAQTAGFADRATNAALNAARNRQAALAQQADMRFRLNRSLLTDAQHANLTEQLASLQIGDPISETYQLNASPVEVSILTPMQVRDALDVLASATLTADSAPLTVTLPTDGWHVIQKTSAGVALLAASGIYPLQEVNVTRSLPNGGSASITQYARITDDFTLEDAPPSADGGPLPVLLFNDTRYQGTRPLADTLSLFVAPLFRMLGWPLAQLALIGALGYVGGGWLARVLPPVLGERGDRRRRVRGMVGWLWLVYLIALFLLCYGIDRLDAIGVGILISRFVWVGWMYFVGMNLERSWGRPLFMLASVLGIVQSFLAERPYEKIGDSGAVFVALLGIAVWFAAGLYAAGRGRSQRERYGDPLRLRALMVAAVLWLILFVTPPLVLAATSDDVNNLLPVVDTQRWGGFMLTALLTIVGILASFPLGVLLALGRRSQLPVVRWTSIVYIELVRGVPLITVLYMAQLLVPLVNPALANVDNVFRAMVGVTLFSAAYLAENVRGGLQAIPHGQEEAAKALGLGTYQITLFILLPQALRIVIPALVGQAIALFKDTSLVALVGLIDLMGIGNSLLAQADYNGLQSEVYLFVSVIYFAFSYLMAWVSRRIEASGSGAARRV